MEADEKKEGEKNILPWRLPFRGFGIAGHWGVGKSLMALDLLVMAHAAGVSKEDLLVLDTHGSVEPYLLLERYREVFTYKQCLLHGELLKTIQEIKKSGKAKKILVFDTVEMLQDVLVTQIFEDQSISDAFREKMSGVLWGRVKTELLKKILDLFVHVGESAIFTIHTSSEYVGNKPSGRMKAKFLAPFFQLCQAVAVLSRQPNSKLPDANFFPPLGKSQFPALPPAIASFSWDKFFKYIGQTPADWNALKKEETVTNGLELLEKMALLSGPGTEDVAE